MKDILKEYIIKKYGIENFEEIIKKNYLNYIYVEEPHNVKLLLNKANVMLLQNELIKICKRFDEQKIKYITFKGAVLSNRLYDNIYTRFFSDIDIFVFPQHFEKALDVLYNNGYVLRYPNALSNPHHVGLKNGKIVVELHKNIFASEMEINETYLYNHLDEIIISNQKIITFDNTATLLQLIYHLYMHSSTQNNLYSLIVDQTPTQAERFLHRAYEIALFVEKYSDVILWDDIIDDLKLQKLHIIFKIIVCDISKIFPNIFPDRLIRAIKNLNYINDQDDKKFIELLCASEKGEIETKKAISKLVQTNWRAENNLATYKSPYVFNWFKNQEKTEDFYENQPLCKCCMKRIKNGLKINFDIYNDDLCVSDYDCYDTKTSDGVHLLLYSTQNFSYRSIFFYPKEISKGFGVVAYDHLDDCIIDRKQIKANFTIKDNRYIINVFMSEEFLKSNGIDKQLYLGLVISDCNSETKNRKNTYILSKDQSKWYDPSYFTKIKF